MKSLSMLSAVTVCWLLMSLGCSGDSTPLAPKGDDSILPTPISEQVFVASDAFVELEAQVLEFGPEVANPLTFAGRFRARTEAPIFHSSNCGGWVPTITIRNPSGEERLAQTPPAALCPYSVARTDLGDEDWMSTGWMPWPDAPSGEYTITVSLLYWTVENEPQSIHSLNVSGTFQWSGVE